MKSIFNYIIKTESRYNNKINIDGIEMVVNTEITERDATFVNRIGTVTSVPVINNEDIAVGDQVIVHHNVFRRWLDGNQREKNSFNYFKEDTYFVYEDQIFAYKRNGVWNSCRGYCFVKPIENEETWINGNEKMLQGIMVYPDKLLVDQGIEKGALVGYTPNSEYEFNIDDQKLYRIFSNQINVTYESEERKVKINQERESSFG